MYNYRTLVFALTKDDPCMAAVISYITRIYCPVITGQICLRKDASPSKRFVIRTNLTRNNGISTSDTRFALHYLICCPAYKTGTVKTFGTICCAEIPVIVIIITTALTIVEISHCLACSLSCGIIPAAAPYIKSLSNRL